MKTIKFKRVKGTVNNATIGVFLENGNPFAYGHYKNGYNDNDLCLAFRNEDEKYIDIAKFVVAVYNETGAVKGMYSHKVTYNNNIVNDTIKVYLEQEKKAETI